VIFTEGDPGWYPPPFGSDRRKGYFWATLFFDFANPRIISDNLDNVNDNYDQSYPYNSRRRQFDEIEILDLVLSNPKRIRHCEVNDGPLKFSIRVPFDLKAEDLKSKINVADGTLEIMIDKEIDDRVMKNGWDGKESTSYKLTRCFKLPNYVLGSEKLQKDVSVKLKDSIITVTLPKEKVESKVQSCAERKPAESNKEKKISENSNSNSGRIPIVLIE